MFGCGPSYAVKGEKKKHKEDQFNRNEIMVVIVLGELCLCVSSMSN